MGQIDAVLKPLQNRVVNQGRIFEHLTAMDHSVSYGIYVSRTLDFRYSCDSKRCSESGIRAQRSTSRSGSVSVCLGWLHLCE